MRRKLLICFIIILLAVVLCTTKFIVGKSNVDNSGTRSLSSTEDNKVGADFMLKEINLHNDGIYKMNDGTIYLGQFGEIFYAKSSEEELTLLANEKYLDYIQYSEYKAIGLLSNGILIDLNFESNERIKIAENVIGFYIDNDKVKYASKTGKDDGEYSIVNTISNVDQSIEADKYAKMREKKVQEYISNNKYTEYPIFICEYNNWYYYGVRPHFGAGSGEYFKSPAAGMYFGVNREGTKIREFSKIKAEYIKVRDGWLYFMDLSSSEQDYYPGRGKIYRMRPDGTEIKKLTDDIAHDNFYIYYEWIFYRIRDNENRKTVRIFLDGSEKKAIGNNYLDLLFYGDWIIGESCFLEKNKKMILKVDGSFVTVLPREFDEYRVINWNDNSVFFLNDENKLVIYNWTM